MAIKSILLHMAPDESRQHRMQVALDLTARYDADLEIVYMLSPSSMPAAIQGRGASHAYIAEATAIAAEKADGVRAEVAETCPKAGIRWEWHVLEGDHNELLAERSHFADLMIVSQAHGAGWEGHVGLHDPDELLMTSSCPVLLTPRDGMADSVGKRVLLAWKDTKEAARAVRDGMGILQSAEHVVLLTCDRPHHRFEGGLEIVSYLKRHGVEVEPMSDIGTDNVGQVILSYAADMNADLVLMGAYGRPRWREIVLGGATRHVLSHMTLPILMSH